MDVFDRIPKFKSCCIYVPLHTATIIISWFSVITACVYILASGVVLLSGSNRKPEHHQLHKLPHEDTSDFFWYSMLLIGILSLVVGGLAIIGINRSERNYLKIFLVWKLIHLTLEIITALVFTNTLLLLIFAFKGYLWLVVFSYYKGMCEEKEHDAPTPT